MHMKRVADAERSLQRRMHPTYVARRLSKRFLVARHFLYDSSVDAATSRKTGAGRRAATYRRAAAWRRARWKRIPRQNILLRSLFAFLRKQWSSNALSPRRRSAPCVAAAQRVHVLSRCNAPICQIVVHIVPAQRIYLCGVHYVT
eukprot:IDg13820t1